MRVAVAVGLDPPSQCTYRCVVLPDRYLLAAGRRFPGVSQCTYRCVVLPDGGTMVFVPPFNPVVSMHLQVRGAP